MKVSTVLSTVALLATSVVAVPTSSNSLTKREGPGTTLQEGYYWVRAVVEPYFHFYLQTDPLYSASTAIMGDHTTAGQFQITDGQFEALIDTDGTLYYLVPDEANATDKKLPLAFSKTKSTLGTFEWQGDSVTWTADSIERSNPAAFLICTPGDELFINLGDYGYQTPEGCSDATIHYYNDASASE
ncbi:hypothetical protein FQN54_000534 [Arachnomyces sp. PD_36]|nr:hypothetical protein FQN54_000534 [Arachnomyces sp. PD_36]